MDVTAELERVIEEMEKGVPISTLMAITNEIFTRANGPNPPPSPPSSPSPVSAGLEMNSQPQPVERQGGEYGDCTTLGADLHLPNQWPANRIPTAAAVDHPAAASAPQNIPTINVDVMAELEQVIEEMESGECITTLMATANKIFTKANGPNPPTPPPSPPPPVPAELEINMQPQPVERQGGEYGDCTPLRANPPTVEQQSSWMAAPTMYTGPVPVPQGGIMQPVHLHGQAGAYSQGQYLPYQRPMGNIPTVAVAGQPAAAVPLPQTAPIICHPVINVPPDTYDSVPPMRLSNGQSLRCVGVLNGEFLYEVPAGHVALPVFGVPPLNTSNSKKRKRENDDANERPYVKKPPNAFLLFMKAHRAKVEAEFQGRGSAAINSILGQLWSSLTKEEQAKYYKQAERERVLHAQRHPEWSPSDNYGKKSKRQRSKAVAASASRPDEDTQQNKRLCVTAVQTAPMEPSSTSQAPVTRPHDVPTVLVTEAPHTPTVQVQRPDTQTAETVPMCVQHLPQLCEVNPAFMLVSPEATSTSLASPAAPTQSESTHY